MYRVVSFFTDLQDDNYAYNVGDKFPRDGMVVSNERINELLSDQNKQHRQLIQFVDEFEEVAVADDSPVAEGEKVYDEETLSEMTTREIKALAAERGYKITKNAKADVIEQFLDQQR